MPTITPFLWFNSEAEEAIAFYSAIFPDTAVLDVIPGAAPAARPAGFSFRLLNQDFIAINGGPTYAFTPAVSLCVGCETQAEIDGYWERLLADGGTPQRCGWLADRYGLSWQVVPTRLGALLRSADQAAAGRVMAALMGMVRIDLAVLEAAFAETDRPSAVRHGTVLEQEASQ